jgi:LemA protein
MKWIAVGVVIVAILLVLGVIGMYNNFVTLDQGVKSSWSEVENQYQRQADVIPNLVSTVSSAVKVETKFVTDVTAARTQWLNAQPTDLLSRDTAGVSMQNAINAFIRAVATTENYPVLQANKNYLALQDELVGAQNRITNARRLYIESIQAYNTAIQRFPGVLFAGTFGFSAKQYYQAAPGALTTPILGTGTLP